MKADGQPSAEPVLVKSRPRTSALDFAPGEVERFLRERLSGRNVEGAYLFGSFAEGTCGPWSDVDVVIITNTEASPVERPREFFDLFDLGLPVDILVYTPAEFADVRNSETGFWKEFRRTCKKIF